MARQCRGGFIEDQKLSTRCQRDNNLHTLPLTRHHLADKPARADFQSELLRHALQHMNGLRFANKEISLRQRKKKVFHTRKLINKAVVLLNDTDTRRDAISAIPKAALRTPKHDLTLIWRIDASENAHQRAFARPIFT